MRITLACLCFTLLYGVSYGADQSALEDLHSLAVEYIKKDEKSYNKWVKKVEERLQEKEAVSEDAKVGQFIQDWLVDNRAYILLEKDADKKKVTELAYMFKYLFDKGFVWADWIRYKEKIVAWSGKITELMNKEN